VLVPQEMVDHPAMKYYVICPYSLLLWGCSNIAAAAAAAAAHI
jgi:hypothetical protein